MAAPSLGWHNLPIVAGRELDQNRIALRAAPLRLVFGLFAVTLLPYLYPGLGADRWLFALYLLVGAASLVALAARFGGMWRPAAAGVIDLSLITFVVHRVGSVGTMIVALYLLACVFNALVVGRRVGIGLALGAAFMHGAVVAAEGLGWLPYAPAAPPWARLYWPGAGAAIVSWLLGTAVTVISTAVVGMLVYRLRASERLLRRQGERMHEANVRLEDANRRLEELSQRDPLTQLFNRRHLFARLEAELERGRRSQQKLCAVMIDLDRFKRVNDTQGHEKGDALLNEIAAELAQSTRATDLAGRYGGDEFVVLMPDTDAESARVAAERLRAAVRAVGLRFDAESPVTASIGVASAFSEDSPRPLLRRADHAAYAAKQQGGDRVVFAPETDSE